MLDKNAYHARVCERHFDASAILVSSNRKLLKKGSVPRSECKLVSKETQTTPDLWPDLHSEYSVKVEVKTEPLDVDDHIMTISDCLLDHNYTFRASVDCEEIDTQKISKNSKPRADPDDNYFFGMCDKFLSKGLSEIVKKQANLKKRSFANRYTSSSEYKRFCLALFYTSPKAYNLLKETLCLPGQTVLNNMKMPINTEIQNSLIKALETKAKIMPNMDKNCFLAIDTITLTDNLFYNIKEDRIYGFHEKNGIQSPELAKVAVVAMVHCIADSQKQLVGYALLGQSKIHENICEWIDALIYKLLDIGLFVRAVVSNITTDLFESAMKRSVSTETPFFLVHNRKVYYMFDPSNLMLMMRNNLMEYDFEFNGLVAKWHYIADFHEKDKMKKLWLCRNLTESHVYPDKMEKNNVELAVQLFSYSVAAGMSTYRDFGAIDPFSKGTIKLIEMMSDLFDFLNSSNTESKKKYGNAYCAEADQTSFLSDMLDFFASLKFCTKTDDQDAEPETNFTKGFQITLKSLILLYQDLNVDSVEDISYKRLATKRLHLDDLQKFFKELRNKTPTTAANSVAPTSWKLASAFRKFVFVNHSRPLRKRKHIAELGKVLLDGEYSVDDMDNMDMPVNSETVSELSEEKHVRNDTSEKIPPIYSTDYNKLLIPKKHPFVYISEFLLRKCAVKHKYCRKLKDYMTLTTKTPDDMCTRYNAYCIDGGKELQVIPKDDLVAFVESLEEQFSNYFQETFFRANNGVLRTLLDSVESVAFSMPCTCFPLKYCKMLYFRLRIYFVLRHNNQIHRSTKKHIFSVPNLK